MKISTLNKIRRDERGNVGMMAAFAMIIVSAGVGAAVDYSTANNARDRTQDVADSLALRASAFVREHDREPNANDENALPAGTYTAAQLGYDQLAAASDVRFTLVYDMDAGEARVTAVGKAPTSFSKAMGFDDISINSQSTATFVEKAVKDVATVVMVLDNSGSMWWDTDQARRQGNRWIRPQTDISRMDALKNSSKSFMGNLQDLIGDDSDQRIVRTGMVGFERRLKHQNPPSWGTIPDHKINAMRPGGGTVPDPAVRKAYDWMRGEDQVHLSASGKNPLKYVILITDGENDQVGSEWEEKNGTGKWRRLWEREHEGRNSRNSRWRRWGFHSWYEYDDANSNPDTRRYRWTDEFDRRGRGRNRWYRQRYNYDVRPYSEGYWTRPTDDKTIKACQDLKADGVTVYSIGFGLEPGTYFTNNRSDTRTLSNEASANAYNVLRQCASDEDSFIIAKDSEALQSAFETIGEDIMEEVIRVKS